MKYFSTFKVNGLLFHNMSMCIKMRNKINYIHELNNNPVVCIKNLSFQIESVLHQILEELKLLYSQHAPQLKPRPRDSMIDPEIQDTGQGVDPVYDMYTVLEGSALIPFIEVHFEVHVMQGYEYKLGVRNM